MQQLWGMIRALQMIILSALVRTPIPAVTFMFFQGCMMFAQMDIFDGQGWYEQWFEFKETTMHSEMFEMMGIGDKNFMMNSGSYFIIGGGLALYYIGRYILNSFAKSYPSSRTIRKIGIYAYEQSYLGNFWMAFLKLTVESYFDLAMCSALAALAMMEVPRGTNFSSFFQTGSDAMNNTFTIFYTILSLITPFVAYRVLT